MRKEVKGGGEEEAGGKKTKFSRQMWQGGRLRLPRKDVWSNLWPSRAWCGSAGAAIACLCPACPSGFLVSVAHSVFVPTSCPSPWSDFHFRMWGLRKNKVKGEDKIETELLIRVEVQDMKFSDSEIRGDLCLASKG